MRNAAQYREAFRLAAIRDPPVLTGLFRARDRWTPAGLTTGASARVEHGAHARDHRVPDVPR